MRLQSLAIGQKALEGIAAALAGIAAGSVALVALALLSGMDAARLFLKKASSEQKRSGSGPSAAQLLGCGALAAGGYLLLRASYVILAEVRPASTLFGEALAEVSIVLTVILFWTTRRRVGASARNEPFGSVRSVTVRLALTASVLAGLVLNAVFGLWKADPLSALPIAAFFFTTGEQLLRNERPQDGPRASVEVSALMASLIVYAGAQKTQPSPLCVIVCGGRGVAWETAQALAQQGHAVSIVENNKERPPGAAKLAVRVVHGDPRHPVALRRAGIERCDVVAALTESAQTNRRICRAAAREAAVRTVVRLPFGTTGTGGLEGENEGVRHLGDVGGDLHLLELRVADGAPLAGKRLSQIQGLSGGRVLSRPDGQRVRPAETVFAPGGRYVIAARTNATEKWTRLFRGLQTTKSFL